MKRTRVAFTLIELLVVIAIIAILAAILFPVFAKAREKARQTTCASNEKQLGLAMLQYVQDYDEFPPCGTAATFTNPPTCSWSNENGAGWAGQIYAYAKSTQVYTCPDDKNAGQSNMYIWPTNPRVYGGTAVDYGYNPMLIEGGGVCPPVLYNSSKLNAPAVTVCLMEVSTDRWGSGIDVQNAEQVANSATPGVYSPICAMHYSGCISVFSGGNNTATIETGPIGCSSNASGFGYVSTDFPTGRHSDGSNFLFWDGHVKWLRGSSVSYGNNAAHSTDADPCNGINASAGTQGTMNGVPVTATFSVY